MKKRLICALLLLAFCFTVCLSSYIAITKMSNSLIIQLEDFIRYAKSKQSENAVATISDCSTKWERRRTVFGIFLDHEMFERLNVSLPTILQLYKNGDENDACENAVECARILRTIIEEQQINLENILKIPIVTYS